VSLRLYRKKRTLDLMIILMKFSTYLPSCFFLSFSTSESFKYCSLTLTQSNLSLFTGLECFQREDIQKIHSIMSNLPYSMVKKTLHKCTCFFFLCWLSFALVLAAFTDVFSQGCGHDTNRFLPQLHAAFLSLSS